ncbi:MAG: ComEC/Rec2 family competence protein [Microthrixaceae bacterium]|nr:ComEC/Rec2 family competence protein [Microthrixaceae bacterium]
MSDAQVVVLAVSCAAAAALAIDPGPWWALGCVMLLGIGSLAARRFDVGVTARSFAVAAALVLLAAWLGHRAEVGLGAGAVGACGGRAVVVADPVRRFDGVVLEVSMGGARYSAAADGRAAADLAPSLVGWQVDVEGSCRRLDGPWSWRASRHLAGRMSIRRAAVISQGSWWWASANALRGAIDRSVAGLDPDARALALGIVVGDDRGQSDLDIHRFRVAGLSHLMAVSGQNVAFVLLAASPLVGRLTLGWRWLATVAVLGWFTLVARSEPSVLRAVSMGLVAATVTWRGRVASGLRVVAVAVVGLVLVDPLIVWSFGFQLSVCATVALVVGARRLGRRLPGPRWLAVPLAVSVVAQAGTAPLLVAIGGAVPLLGPVTNLAAVPVAGWLMVTGVSAGPVAGWVGSWPAALVSLVDGWMVAWISGVARVGSNAALPTLGPPGAAAWVAAVMAVLAWPQATPPTVRGDPPEAVARRRWRARGCGAVLAVAALVIGGDAALRLPATPHAPAGAEGFRVWRSDGVGVVVVSGWVPDRTVFDAVRRSRVRRVAVALVTGSGRSVSATVWALRQAVAVETVVAADPGSIRDAVGFTQGSGRVGDLDVEASVRGGEWAVKVGVASGG